MDLQKIAEKISKNWSGLPSGLNYTYDSKFDVIYFDYLSGDDVVELNTFAEKHNKRLELYHAQTQIKVCFKNTLDQKAMNEITIEQMLEELPVYYTVGKIHSDDPDEKWMVALSEDMISSEGDPLAGEIFFSDSLYGVLFKAWIKLVKAR